MKMTLPRFGIDEVEIDPNTLIAFPNGLPGFDDCKNFKLFHSENNPAIFWLQSTDNPEVVFSMTDPEMLHIHYDITFDDEELNTLQIDADDELQIAVFLSRQAGENTDAPGAIQANFRSPIVINVSKRIALQKSLRNPELSVCTYHALSEIFKTSPAPIEADSDSLCAIA